MAAGALLPAGYETLEDANGTTVPGGLIWTYAAGTTTPLATFTDSTLTVPNANPIIADGAGRWTAYAAPGTGFKLVFETPAIPPVHGATIKTCDNIVAPLTDATAGATGGVTNVSDNTTGSINNFVLPGRTKDTLWSWNGSADLTLTGIAGGASGDRLTIKNMSTVANRKILLPHMSVSSTNGFYNLATSAPTPIAPSGWAAFVFVGGSWVMTDHDQGDPLQATFSNANYSGGTMFWNLTAGATTTMYVLRGRTLWVSFYLGGVAIGGVAGNSFAILNGAYGGFVVSQNTMTNFIYNDAGAGNTVGFMQAGPGASSTTQLTLLKLLLANFTIGTPTSMYGEILLAVT